MRASTASSAMNCSMARSSTPCSRPECSSSAGATTTTHTALTARSATDHRLPTRSYQSQRRWAALLMGAPPIAAGPKRTVHANIAVGTTSRGRSRLDTTGDPHCAKETLRNGLVAALLGRQDLELVGRIRSQILLWHREAGFIRRDVDIQLRQGLAAGFNDDNVIADNIDWTEI